MKFTTSIPSHLYYHRIVIFLLLLLQSVFVCSEEGLKKETQNLEVTEFSYPDGDNNYSFSYSEELPSDSTLQLINKITSLSRMIETQGRFIDRLEPDYEVKYPIGIVKNIGGLSYVVALESDEITTQGAFINAYMSFIVPQSQKQLSFASNKIPLSATGGLTGQAELTLVKNEIIELGNSMQLILYGADNKEQVTPTKVRFDCNGFVDMTVSAGIEFSKNLFVREDPVTGKQITTENFTVFFQTVIQSWSDLIVQVDLPPFQFKPLKGFGFQVRQATFDMSDLNNPSGMIFPKDYTGIEAYGDFPQLWHGFYLRQATLRLPAKLNNGKRMEVLAQNLIIDEAGITGLFAMTNLLALDEGNIGGWAFSIDSFKLSLLTNTIVSAGMNGKINMPVMDSTDYMVYNAVIDYKGDFIFSTSMPESFNANVFAATMTIYETSVLTIQEINDQFSVNAVLHGEISVNAPVGKNASDTASKKGFVISGLKFENMVVSSTNPYFKPGIWSLAEAGVNSLKGFSLSLSDVKGFEENNDVGLLFTASVGLSGSESEYSASTTLKIIGTRYTQTVDGDLVKHRLKYKKTELQDLYICVKDKAISLEGYLAIFDEDPVYGDGYAGMVNAMIVNKIGVRVSAVFGKVNSFNYWYADALANFSSSPVMIFPGIFMKGIGGGAYKHMKQAIPEGVSFSDANIKSAKSRILYIPDKNVAFGFKASLAFGTSPGNGFNAMATFEIVFNSGGGVNMAMFYGTGVLMKELDFSNPTGAEAPVKADVLVKLDFQNNTFHGNFKVYVNAVGGMLTGVSPNNLAGEMVIHADPIDWYIHVGRPSARVGLQLKVFGLTIRNGSYFMMGTRIEEMPPPPDEVLRLLKMPIPEKRDNAELASAKGFAFGSYFSMSTGNLKALIFYASFDMGIGFDVMLSDKGETYCVETGKKIGINGWYAEGQLYAFVEGSIGIDINIFMIKVHQEILSLGAAVLLETKLPNPFWMRGTVGGYYSLLGGRIKGNCRFRLEIGNQCTMKTIEKTTNPVEGLSVISELTPGDGRSSVDVFTTPQVVFNYQIGSSFRISDSIESREQYRIAFDDFRVTANNAQVTGIYQWNETADVLMFSPRDILPGKTRILLEAKVHFEVNKTGIWETVKLENGQEAIEIKTASFVTGEEPDYIPASNVLHSYPLKDMMNLYKNEFGKGHIQLKWGQEKLFQPDAAKWKQFARYTPVSGGNPLYANFTYHTGDKKVEYPIAAQLANNTIYRFELINIPAEAAAAIDANIRQISAAVTKDGAEMEMVSKTAVSTRSELQAKVIYTCYFRTSMFNTLADKIGSITKTYTVSNGAGLSPFVSVLNSLLIIPEPFDKYEIIGDDSNKPLVNLWASKDGRWLRERQIPFIYNDYPITPRAIIINRDTSILGFVPVKRVFIDTYEEPYRLLTDNETSTGITNFTSVKTYLNYNISPDTYYDYLDILNILVYETVILPRRTELLTRYYPPVIINEAYPVNAQYQLPATGATGTKSIINLFF